MYTLGRRPAPDARDGRYPFALALAGKKPVKPPRSVIWPPGPMLDQGETPRCVGYAWTQYLQTFTPGDDMLRPDADSIYRSAQRYDEWEGEEYDGTSVRGGAKALVAHLDVATYLWAQGSHDFLFWLRAFGPIVVGTNWYEGMFEPDEQNVVHPRGQLVGGHAYLCIGYDAGQRLYRFANSWGAEWGDGGCFWMRPQDVSRLVFREEGEACAAVEAAYDPNEDPVIP